MIYPDVGHAHWQKKSSLCTAYAFTHVVEAVLKKRFPDRIPHTAPLSIAWKGYRGMGMEVFTGRAMSVYDIWRGVTKTTPINVGLRHQDKEKIIAVISGFGYEKIEFPSLEEIKSLLEESPVLAYLKAAHSLNIMGWDEHSLIQLDPQNPKKKRSKVPLEFHKSLTEAYNFDLDIQIVE